MKKVINIIVFVICIVLLSVNVEADEITVSDQIVDERFVPERFDMAYRAERNTLYRYQRKRSDVAVCHDFHAANDPDKYYPSNPAFKVKRISKYGTQVHLSYANVIAHFATINYN